MREDQSGSHQDDASLLTDRELEHGPRRPWLGPHRPFLHTVVRPVMEFLEIEAAGGYLLLVAAGVALLWANSPWQDTYNQFWSSELGIEWGRFELREPLLHWVNDGLMVLFFFVVGMEIKSALVRGQLSSLRQAALPTAAAIGGMVVPALIYLGINAGDGGSPVGWGIPVATDIAFALGVLALLGERASQSLKLLLLAVAMVDDVGAILVIAVFYTEDFRLGWLVLGVALLVVVAALKWVRVWYIPLYVVLGAGVWFGVHLSGVHPTIAGVALGLLAPARPLLSRRQVDHFRQDREAVGGEPSEAMESAFVVRESVPISDRLQGMLHPWSSYVIIPLFALANAGITFDREIVTEALTSPVAIGVVAGLVLGKPLGVLAVSWGVSVFGRASVPDQVDMGGVTAIGVLAGIGFTMSLFIAGLAFPEGGGELRQAKLGIITASIIAAVLGILVVRFGPGSAREAGRSAARSHPPVGDRSGSDHPRK